MRIEENFEIKKLLKSNNYTRVYLIKNDDKKMILKTVVSPNVSAINMLKNEVENLMLLQNENIAPKVIEYKFDDEYSYVILEFIEGLAVNKIRDVSVNDKLTLIFKMLETIKKIHKLGIVHCDLKPSHIIFAKNHDIKIIDFGIALRNGENIFKGYGSVRYCSVEQLLGKEITFYTDLYALGIVIYEILIEKLPFEGSKSEIKEKKLNCRYSRTDNQLLNLIILKLFEVNNPRRYKKIEELEIDLRFLLR